MELAPLVLSWIQLAFVVSSFAILDKGVCGCLWLECTHWQGATIK